MKLLRRARTVDEVVHDVGVEPLRAERRSVPAEHGQGRPPGDRDEHLVDGQRPVSTSARPIAGRMSSALVADAGSGARRHECDPVTCQGKRAAPGPAAIQPLTSAGEAPTTEVAEPPEPAAVARMRWPDG